MISFSRMVTPSDPGVDAGVEFNGNEAKLPPGEWREPLARTCPKPLKGAVVITKKIDFHPYFSGWRAQWGTSQDKSYMDVSC